MIQIPYSANFSDNLSKASREHDSLPCAVCGKAVTNPKWWVHVHCGGSHLVTDEEATTLNADGEEAADMYLFPLGRDCYRKHPELQAYATKQAD